jgi:hypothetical protein
MKCTEKVSRENIRGIVHSAIAARNYVWPDGPWVHRGTHQYSTCEKSKMRVGAGPVLSKIAERGGEGDTISK